MNKLDYEPDKYIYIEDILFYRINKETKEIEYLKSISKGWAKATETYAEMQERMDRFDYDGIIVDDKECFDDLTEDADAL